MSAKTVLVYGAGATAACGGPLTANILPEAFQAFRDQEDPELFGREDFFCELATFLKDEFHVNPLDGPPPSNRDYPPLPLLLSLVDTAIDRKQPLGLRYGQRQLRKVRQAVEYAVFALLDHRLTQLTHNFYREALDVVANQTGEDPAIITLNYDIIVDNAMLQRNADSLQIEAIPDYGVDLHYSRAVQPEKKGRLLKIHGSLNWFHCPACNRLSLGINRRLSGTYKVTNDLFAAGHDLNDWYTCHGKPCMFCVDSGQVPEAQVFVEPLLITPTHLKDYRNSHISRLWYLAENTLREAERVIFIGYSLPDDDLEVAYLLKRGLAGKDPACLSVVEYDPDQHRGVMDHQVGRRYRSLLGVTENGWRTDGFQGWIADPRF